ncbi:hypothetical protein HPB50_003169 [Hyalomma asiaticum]|uniref:Uncharacterized protein n=1 Tax=Hyalomma asiaticum TaxID=266040 RepID=A0ACB7T5M2_HYAAI|nr:hypothetical protein HPB50_003169 [Hyalomma asiaticum]
MAAPRKAVCSQSYSGCNFFRQRLVLSTLSSKPVEIKNIRHKEEEPGLKKFEVDLLKLLEKVTNGTAVEISETGTCVRYRPGLLYGAKLSMTAQQSGHPAETYNLEHGLAVLRSSSVE